MKASKLGLLMVIASLVSMMSWDVRSDELQLASPRTEIEPPSGGEASPAITPPELTLAVPDAPGPGVGLNQRIIGTVGCQDSEIAVAASRDGRNVLVASNGDFVVSSQDGGANWSAPAAWPNGGGSTRGDPMLAVGLSNAVYLAYIWRNPAPSCDFGLAISTDQGLNFAPPVSAVTCPPSANGCFPDQETIAADQVNPGSAGGDQIYLAWRQFTNIGCPNAGSGNTDASIACSQDGGQNWTAPVLVDAAGDRPRPAVAPDGSVYVVYVNGDGGAINVDRFTSCSNGLTPIAGYPYTVAPSSSVTGVPNLDRQGQEGNPMIAVDPYNSELVYVVYGQDTSGSTSGDPGIFLRVSSDGGATWTAAIQVNDNIANDTSRYFPWIAANPADGSMNIGWYDRRDDPANNDLTAYFGARVTGGGTPSLAVGMDFRISDVDYASSMPGSTCFSPIYGDYNMLAAGPNFMYAAWASPASPFYITPASADIDVFFAAIVAGDIPQISTSGILDFGGVCVDSSDARDLDICNTGKTDLVVNSITSSLPQFAIGPVNFPLVISPDFCFPVPVIFTPTSTAEEAADLTIVSNDPVNPITVLSATGTGVTPDIRLTGSADFGDVCADAPEEKTVSVCNVGPCDLEVSSASIDCADFTLVNNPFPATVSPDSCLNLVVAFTPTTAGPKACTLTVVSDDPDTPVGTLDVTATTPFASIDVPPDQSFRPTVIQSVDVCESTRFFPVSNTGQCDLDITDLSISANPTEYSLSGLPSFPIILEPGHLAGAGDLRTVFAPENVDRDVDGEVSVSWVHDPVTGATMTETRNLCGEGARTGARVLVTKGGVPLDTVKSIRLHRINANRNNDRLDTVDNARNLPLQTVTPNAPCTPFGYHREYGTVSNPIQLLPGSYQVSVQTRIDGKMRKRSVGFDVNSCGFNPTIIVNFE